MTRAKGAKLPLNIDDLIHQRKVESARIEYKKDWNPEKVAPFCLRIRK